MVSLGLAPFFPGLYLIHACVCDTEDNFAGQAQKQGPGSPVVQSGVTFKEWKWSCESGICTREISVFCSNSSPPLFQ